MAHKELLDRNEIAIKEKNLVDNLQSEKQEKKTGEGLNKFNFTWGLINIFISAFLLIVVTPGARNILGFSTNKEAEKLENTILPVQSVEIEKVDAYSVKRNYSGKISANRTSELGFERSGQILKIFVEEGDKVVRGTPLAYLDTRSLKAQERELIAQRAQAKARLRELKAGPRSQTIEASRASVRDLEAQLNLAQRKKQRRQQLFSQGAISNEQLDEVTFEKRRIRARLEEAQSRLNELLAGTRPEIIQGQQARVERLNASLENLRIELEKSILRSPFDGTISLRRVDEGSAVSASQPVLRLVENRKIEAKIGIPVTTASQIKIGSSQDLEVNGENYPAVVTSLLPELDSRNRTVTVVLTLDRNKFQNIWPGQVAKLEVTENIAGTGYWVPTTALVRGTRGLWSAYVLGDREPGKQDTFKLTRKYVEVIHAESDRVFVRGTLEPKDRIVINGTHRLVPGQLVTSIKE